MRRMSLMCIALLLGTAPAPRAQEKKPTGNIPVAAKGAAADAASNRGDDEKALAALVATYTKAFNAGDADATAATFAVDALVVDEHGDRTEGRSAIREQLAEAFTDSPGSKIAIETKSLRFLGPDTALEEGRTIITPPGAGAPEITRFTVIYIKRAGQWFQSAVRDDHDRDLTPHDHLKELEWMLGEWVNESQDAIVNTTVKWTADGNFLVRDFTMKMQGQPVFSGSQRIGWDPVRRQFKNWIFDSEGGFAEGFWTRDGNRWVIKVEGTGRDGRPISQTNIFTQLGKDRATWQSVDRTVGATALPGIDEFVIVRKPPDAGK